MFTDIVGSTALWDMDHASMAAALIVHDRVVVEAVHQVGGDVVKHTGDGFMLRFNGADEAVEAAIALTTGLAACAWPAAGPMLTARVGIHTGLAHLREGDYFGPGVNVTARVTAIAQGRQVLLSDVSRAQVTSSAPVGFRQLGVVCLKGVEQAMAIHQLIHPSLIDDFFALPSLPRPLDVPPAPTALIGRGEVAEQILNLVNDHSLVTLVGPGGVGKTRLATHVAMTVNEHDIDTVWWCDLSQIGEQDSVARALLASGGLRPSDATDMTEQVENASAGHNILVVADNAEHVLEDAARTFAAILAAAPRVRLLVTSRQPLGLDGERVVHVEPLSVEAAIALFGERARAANPSFAITDANQRSLEQLCARLDGLPLALELAAARTLSLAPADILRLLDDRHRLLRHDGAGTTGRHRSVEATMAWSFDLLSEHDRRSLARLSLFAAPFDLDAAHAVTAEGDDDTIDSAELLGRLARRSLLEVGQGEPTRYRLLETIRSYGRAFLLQTGDVDGARRWSAHFIGSAEQIAAEVTGPGAALAIRRANDLLAHFRSVFTWAVGASELDAAMSLVANLATYAYERMHVEIGGWAARLLDAGLDRGSAQWSTVVGTAAQGAWLRGELHEAQRLAAAGLAVEPENRRLHNVLGLVALYRGDVEGALVGFVRSFESAVRAGDAFNSARHAGEIAFAQHRLKIPSAVDMAQTALDFARASGADEAAAHAKWALSVCISSVDPDTALDELNDALDLALASDARMTWNAASDSISRLASRRIDGDPKQSGLATVRAAQNWARVGRVPAQWEAIRALVISLIRSDEAEAAITLNGACMAAGVAENLGTGDSSRYAVRLDEARRHVGETTWHACLRRGAQLDQDGLRSFLDEIAERMRAR